MAIQDSFENDVHFIGVPDPGNGLGALTGFVETTGSESITHLQGSDALWSSFDVARRQTFIAIDEDGSAHKFEFDDLRTTVTALANS